MSIYHHQAIRRRPIIAIGRIAITAISLGVMTA